MINECFCIAMCFEDVWMQMLHYESRVFSQIRSLSFYTFYNWKTNTLMAKLGYGTDRRVCVCIFLHFARQANKHYLSVSIAKDSNQRKKKKTANKTENWNKLTFNYFHWSQINKSIPDKVNRQFYISYNSLNE